jgi:hypothetical protein
MGYATMFSGSLYLTSSGPSYRLGSKAFVPYFIVLLKLHWKLNLEMVLFLKLELKRKWGLVNLFKHVKSFIGDKHIFKNLNES